MKYRLDFVTNSSSSSFIIQKSKLTTDQIYKIHNHIYFGKKLGIEYAEERNVWNVVEKNDIIRLSTIIDNFDMEEFLEKIEVPKSAIQVGDFLDGNYGWD